MLMSAIGTFFKPLALAKISLQSLWPLFLLVLTFIVSKGVESASFVNTIGTVFKVIPLILFVLI